MRKLGYGLLCLITLSTYASANSNSPFVLSSAGFANQSTLPQRYTCDGKDISPELEWRGTPEKTASFALIVSDPDAPKGTFYHWALFNIPSTTTQLPEGMSTLPKDAVLGNNSMDQASYKGACPPRGAVHRYIFTLYALDTKINLMSGASVDSLMKAMETHMLAKTELIATYSH